MFQYEGQFKKHQRAIHGEKIAGDSSSSSSSHTMPLSTLRRDWIRNLLDPEYKAPQTRVTQDPVKGRGLELIEPMTRGQMLMEYKGELLTGREADAREEQYATDGGHMMPNGEFVQECYMYYFQLKGGTMCIDGTRTESLGRLINHMNDEPNLVTQKVVINGKPHLVFVAARDIPEASPTTPVELGYRYGEQRASVVETFGWLKRDGESEREQRMRRKQEKLAMQQAAGWLHSTGNNGIASSCGAVTETATAPPAAPAPTPASFAASAAAAAVAAAASASENVIVTSSAATAAATASPVHDDAAVNSVDVAMQEHGQAHVQVHAGEHAKQNGNVAVAESVKCAEGDSNGSMKHNDDTLSSSGVDTPIASHSSASSNAAMGAADAASKLPLVCRLTK